MKPVDLDDPRVRAIAAKAMARSLHLNIGVCQDRAQIAARQALDAAVGALTKKENSDAR